VFTGDPDEGGAGDDRIGHLMTATVERMDERLGIATVGAGRCSLQNWMVSTVPFTSWAK
jgi:hypothetical protein